MLLYSTLVRKLTVNLLDLSAGTAVNIQAMMIRTFLEMSRLLLRQWIARAK